MKDRNAGVYLIRCAKTGGSYVGSSCVLMTRISNHRGSIKLRHGKARFVAAFPSLEDVEIIVLEYVSMPRVDADLSVKKSSWRKRHHRSVARLRRREMHWILALRPTVNVKVHHPDRMLKS